MYGDYFSVFWYETLYFRCLIWNIEIGKMQTTNRTFELLHFISIRTFFDKKKCPPPLSIAQPHYTIPDETEFQSSKITNCTYNYNFDVGYKYSIYIIFFVRIRVVQPLLNSSDTCTRVNRSQWLLVQCQWIYCDVENNRTTKYKIMMKERMKKKTVETIEIPKLSSNQWNRFSAFVGYNLSVCFW